MNLKSKLQNLSKEYNQNQKTVADLNQEALSYIKKTLEGAAKRGKNEFNFLIIKLVNGSNYQVQSGVEESIELTHPPYLLEELEKEGLESSLTPKLDGSKNWILSCRWN